MDEKTAGWPVTPQSGIYGIVCTANDKWYVGQSVDISSRRASHFSSLRRGKHFNRHLQAAYVKYGSAAFEFRVLELCSEDMLDTRECSWIRYYVSNCAVFGYNLEGGGNGKKRVSVETRARMSASGLGRKHSAATRARLADVNRGKRHSAKTRAKLSAAGLGRPVSTLTRVKLSRIHTGKSVSDATRVRIAAARRGTRASELTRLKMSIAHTGRTCSESTRQEMAAAARLGWKKRKGL